MLAVPASASAETHEVAAGDSLWAISRHYGCDVETIQRVNQLDGTLIMAGQKLLIPSCGEGASSSEPATEATEAAQFSGSALVYYKVEPGDTLGKIARRFRTNIDDIRARNGLDGDLIRVGDELRVVPGIGQALRPVVGQSVGSPHAGKLVNAVRLGNGDGFVIRRPHRAWGASHTVHYVERAIKTVRAQFPKIHDLAIGDLSAKGGGDISMHRSHESGRDADIGLYFKKKPKGYPRKFIKGTARNLHFAATWRLLQAFLDTAGEPAGVEYIFMNYRLQKLIYEWATDSGVDRDYLDQVFQYPHGKYARHGIIRHEPGHDAHFHVRFRCPPNDRGCE
jgi:LysM repeat protein